MPVRSSSSQADSAGRISPVTYRPASVPQRSTATPPPQLAIQQGWVRPLRAQWPTWLRLREVRDEASTDTVVAVMLRSIK